MSDICPLCGKEMVRVRTNVSIDMLCQTRGCIASGIVLSSGALAAMEELAKVSKAQDEIIQRWAKHLSICRSLEPDYVYDAKNDELHMSFPEPCTCGLSAALAALRKLRGDAP